VLSIVLSRIYTLRNQRVPLVIEITMDNPGTLRGDACYPVVT